MNKLVAMLALTAATLTASSVLANNLPCPFEAGCDWQQCKDRATGRDTLCVYPATAQPAPAPVVTPPAVFAPAPVATMAPANAPIQQVMPGAIQCAGNACVDPDAGKFCGIHWCVWLLGGVLLLGSVLLYFIMSRIQRGHLVGELRGHMRHWNLLVDKDGNPLPDVSRTVLIEVAKAIEATRGDINANDFLRDLRLSQNGRTAMDDDAILRGFPGTPGNTAAAAGATP